MINVFKTLLNLYPSLYFNIQLPPFPNVPISINYAYVKLFSPNDTTEIDINYNYNLWEIYHGNNPKNLWSEITYTFGEQNNSIVHKWDLSNNTDTYKLFLKNNSLNGYLNLYIDIHQYVFATTLNKTFRWNSNTHHFYFNFFNYYNLGTINISITSNNVLKIPYEFKILNNNSTIIDNTINYRIFNTLNFSKNYHEVVNGFLRITPIGNNNKLVNFICSKVAFFNLYGINFNELSPIERNIGPSIELYFNQETYYDPILGKVILGHTNIYHNFDGILLPRWSDLNGFISIPIELNSPYKFHLLINENMIYKKLDFFAIFDTSRNPYNNQWGKLLNHHEKKYNFK